MTTHGSGQPVFSDLSEAATLALLERKHVGRIAFSFQDRVDIQPINYVYADGWIFGRTRVGTKLSKLAHHPWCAFEVDEVSGLFSWESAVAHGSFHLLDPETGSPDVYEKALKHLRALVPGTFGEDDPTPTRDIVIGVWVQELTGRASRIEA